MRLSLLSVAVGLLVGCGGSPGIGALEPMAIAEFGPIWGEGRVRDSLAGLSVELPPLDWMVDVNGTPAFRAAGGRLLYGLFVPDDTIMVASLTDENAIAHEAAHAIEWRAERRLNVEHEGWAERGIFAAIERISRSK